MKNSVVFAGLFALLIMACDKSEIVNVDKQEKAVLTEEQYQKLEKALQTMPLIIKVKDEKNNRFVDFDVRERTVDFNKAWSFANPQSNTIYAQNGGLVIYVSSSIFNFGSSSKTHTVTAGSTSLKVKTICVAVDASAYAALFQSQTGQLPIKGISVVMGLDADFSLLQNASSANFGDYFHGLAYYLVYDSPANGSYTVFDWTGNSTLSSLDGYAMVFAFKKNNFGGFYFSKDGKLDVSGANMTFNGNYWGIETNFSSISPNLTYNTYSGSGTMGCE